MKLDWHPQKLLTHAQEAHDAAVKDTLEAARENASRNERTGKFKDSLQELKVASPANVFVSRVGSDLASAKVKEKGGYMVGRPYMAVPMPDGSMRSVMAVRVRATPVVTPALPKYREALLRHLKERFR